MKRIFILTIIIAATLLSCSKEEMPQLGHDQESGTYKLVLNVSYAQYGGNTKAEYQWSDGATLYIKFPDAASTTTATYSATTKDWSLVTPQGKLKRDKETSCYISYFEKTPNGDIIELSEDDIIYYDGEAKYLLQYDSLAVSDALIITANLSPKTGRIRFKGESGTKIKLYGTSHYTKFNTTECNYYGKDEELELTVNSDGYTPYIHSYFPNSAKRLEITDKDDNIFVFKCSDEHLAAGASGYFDIPTKSAPGSWSVHTPTRTFKIDGTDIEFKMIFVQYISGSFYLAETETTQKLYNAIMNDNPSYFKSDTKDLPAENIGPDKLNQFLVAIKEKTGYPFTCPTKDQWWHAAKGGNKSINYKYSGSDNADDVAWHYDNSPKMTNSSSSQTTSPVKMKLPNELGFYDMNGNVWEAIIYSTNSNGSYSFHALGGSHRERITDYEGYWVVNRNNITDVSMQTDKHYGFRLCLNI